MGDIMQNTRCKQKIRKASSMSQSP